MTFVAFLALQAKQKPTSATQKAAGMLPEATALRAKIAYELSLMLKHMSTCLFTFAVYCKYFIQTQYVV